MAARDNAVLRACEHVRRHLGTTDLPQAIHELTALRAKTWRGAAAKADVAQMVFLCARGAAVMAPEDKLSLSALQDVMSLR